MGETVNSLYNDLAFALNLHTTALARLQEQVATGSRVNHVSDDPSAAYRILSLESQGRSMNGYIDNLSQTVSTLEMSLTAVEDMVDAFAESKTLLTQINSGLYDAESRASTAEAIDSILEQMVALANSRHLNESLFAGGNTDSDAYAVERTDGRITSVTYQGSFDERRIEVADGIMTSAYYVGEDIFRSGDRSSLVFLGDTGAAAGTGTSSVTGDVWLTVTGSPGAYELSIDDGLTTVSTDGTDTNLAVTDSRTGRVLYVDTTSITAEGIDMVRVPGTYDVFGTLINIRDLLENSHNLSEEQLQELRNNSVSSLEEVRSRLAQATVSIGSKMGFLDDVMETVENVKLETDDETTMLAEADIAQLAIDISRREVLYEMSLSAISRLMSMSLLDFLS